MKKKIKHQRRKIVEKKSVRNTHENKHYELHKDSENYKVRTGKYKNKKQKIERHKKESVGSKKQKHYSYFAGRVYDWKSKVLYYTTTIKTCQRHRKGVNFKC